MDMKLGCLLLVALVCVAEVVTQCNTPFQDCGLSGIKIDKVTLPNCCAAPCVLTRGANHTITVDYTPSKYNQENGASLLSGAYKIVLLI